MNYLKLFWNDPIGLSNFHPHQKDKLNPSRFPLLISQSGFKRLIFYFFILSIGFGFSERAFAKPSGLVEGSSVVQSPYDFFCEIVGTKRIFYSGEVISIEIFLRNDSALWENSSAKKTSLENDKVQILQSGRVIQEIELGLIQAYVPKTVAGVKYSIRSLSLIADERYAPGKDPLRPGQYQVRAIIGGQVSKESSTFSIEPWGEPVKGLQISLKAKETYTVGESIPVEITLRNVGSQAFRCPALSQENQFKRYYWNVMVTPTGSKNNFTLIDKQPNDPHDDAVQKRLILLRPGESRTIIFDLHKLILGSIPFGNQLDKYEVTVMGFFHDETPKNSTAPLWSGDMFTNSVEITIQP